jgi:uncharacterized repeat protein (TIGR03803 family)
VELAIRGFGFQADAARQGPDGLDGDRAPQGALYSTTSAGGNKSENGTVFRLTLCERDMDHEIADSD